MVEVKKWQRQIEMRAAVYEAEIEELREHTKQSKVVHGFHCVRNFRF